jgi:homoserine O-acetyltransferase
VSENGSVGVVEPHFLTIAEPPHELLLECGRALGPITLAYETYGTLNARRDNAVLVLHAFSGDAHAAGYHAGEAKPGWWDIMIGPGKAFDTDRYFVICSNVLGGCKGTTGPSSTDPATGKPYGLGFPVITIKDMVEAQRRLLDSLGIEKLLCVTGGSMGGMQALQWTISYPHRVALAIPIATCARASAQQVAFDEVGRQAIQSDPEWNQGEYYGRAVPHRGLALARMVAHITFLSDASMRRKFGRRLQERAQYGFDLLTEFQVESYLHHQGDSFVKRFDANSYLYLTKAMDYFDLSQAAGSVPAAFSGVTARFLVVSFSSDWLYPSYQSKEIVSALRHNNVEVIYSELQTDAGHDAFLLESGALGRLISSFLANGANGR